MKIRNRIGTWDAKLVTKIAGAQAITLYPLIFFKSQDAFKRFEAHELIHVEQVRRVGWIRFYLSYFLYYIAARTARKSQYDAYISIPWEVEAYENS